MCITIENDQFLTFHGLTEIQVIRLCNSMNMKTFIYNWMYLYHITENLELETTEGFCLTNSQNNPDNFRLVKTYSC